MPRPPSLSLGNGFTDHGVATPMSNHRGIVATVDGQGRNVALVWLFDHRGGYALLMIDVETGKADEIPVPFDPGHDCPYSSILSTRNRFYTHFNSHFVEFDPAQRKFTFCTKTAPQMAMSMTEDDRGRIWSVTYPKSGVVCFDPNAGELAGRGTALPGGGDAQATGGVQTQTPGGSPVPLQTVPLQDFGHVHEENWPQYQRSVAADDAGWIYFAIGNTASQIIAFDPQSSKATPILPPAERVTGTAVVYRDLDGKVYGQSHQGSEGGWYVFHRGVATRLAAAPAQPRPKVIITSSQGLFHAKFPDGSELLRCDLIDGIIATRNAKTGQVVEKPFHYSSDGAHIMGVAAAPNGTICGGTAFPMRFFSYDPRTDVWTNHQSYNQCNTIGQQGNRFFVGGYIHGHLLEWDPSRPWVNTEKGNAASNPRFLTECAPDIYRPHKLLAHPDGHTLLMGGTPDYGYTGGGLLIWDRTAEKGTLLTHKELLPEHSITGLVVLPDGKILGASTTDAGTGGERKAKEAELFLFDLPTRKIEWRAAVIPGVAGYNDLCLGANGIAYGLADGRRYFAFDPAKRQLLHEEDTEPTFGTASYQQGHRKFVEAPDGTIYVLFRKKIARIDQVSHRLQLVTESPVLVQFGGDILDGRIYFGSASHLYSYALPEMAKA